MYKKTILFTLAALLTFAGLAPVSCSSSSTEVPDKPIDPDGPEQPDEPVDDPSLEKITYAPLASAFPNPERGFYYHNGFHFEEGEIPSPLNVNALRVNRQVNRTLLLTQYLLRDFIDCPISEEALELIRTNMSVLREGGMKCILRFAYSDSSSEEDKPWDAEQEMVLRHIEQLKPILREYADVIYVVQAGFVGVWGEWYYTDHFNFSPQEAEEYLPRRRVVEALLEALPEERMVALRTPEAKMMCFDLNEADSVTLATAYDGSVRSRIAAHNDCFLASGNDVGTFRNKADREFWMGDTRYVSMGGETCGVSSFCSCSNSVADMEKYHWSYLNISYHQEVISGWRTDGCFDEIERRLGYRFVLTEGAFTREVEAGKEFRARFGVRNDGFAAPVNPRGAELVITADNDPSERYTVKLDSDPRYWFATQTQTIDVTFTCPALTSGRSYTLRLNLPDGAEVLHDNPLFSIRTANDETWDETTGTNRLYTFTAR